MLEADPVVPELAVLSALEVCAESVVVDTEVAVAGPAVTVTAR
jgi:hypothetical protein